jgi:hypothetical protein
MLKNGIYTEPKHSKEQQGKILKLKSELRTIASKMAKQQAKAQYEAMKLIDKFRARYHQPYEGLRAG